MPGKTLMTIQLDGLKTRTNLLQLVILKDCGY